MYYHAWVYKGDVLPCVCSRAMYYHGCVCTRVMYYHAWVYKGDVLERCITMGVCV
jgi:hypothetical protein